MTAQLPLFALAPTAPHSWPATSRDAAHSIAPHLARLEQLVLDALGNAGGLTAQELEYVTGLAGNTVRPRLWELRKRGLVADSGQTRKTPSGRAAIVWRAR
jgi:predicted ArsR family transcriptional regulator